MSAGGYFLLKNTLSCPPSLPSILPRITKPLPVSFCVARHVICSSIQSVRTPKDLSFFCASAAKPSPPTCRSKGQRCECNRDVAAQLAKMDACCHARAAASSTAVAMHERFQVHGVFVPPKTCSSDCRILPPRLIHFGSLQLETTMLRDERWYATCQAAL